MTGYQRIQYNQRRGLKQRLIHKNNRLRHHLENKNLKLQISYNELQNYINEFKILYKKIQISKNKLLQILIDRVHNYIKYDVKPVEKAIATIKRLGGDVDIRLAEIRHHFYTPDYDPDECGLPDYARPDYDQDYGEYFDQDYDPDDYSD
jgi:hypothetical protein